MIEKLLYEFYQLPTLYKKIADAAGDNFNLFNVLQLQTDEVSHSRILGELLNPNGSHGQGDTFLKLFVQKFDIQNFETENATLFLERSVGKVKITETEAEGGRIDIFIQDKNKVCIAIENKIEALDQDAQLLRYHTFIKEENEKSTLLYLTPFGKDAQEHSIKGKNFQYQIISYANDILNWLLLCREKAANLPLLHASISQYINLIKSLTNQTNHAKMNNEIAAVGANLCVCPNNAKSKKIRVVVFSYLGAGEHIGSPLPHDVFLRTLLKFWYKKKAPTTNVQGLFLCV